MNSSIKLYGFCLLMTIGLVTNGQTPKETALEKGKQAIKLEDEEGKYDEAIKLFKEAQQLDPEDITYPYEISYSYTSKKEYKKAIEILEKLLTHKDVYGRVYQALGNNYDYLGMPDKAIETYKEGLRKFPHSGELYLEMGNMLRQKNEYDKSLPFYEKGIEEDPGFASNYYRASKLFCSSNEVVWGMIYGEIFMNLERNSKRTSEISKLLFDTYKAKIKIYKDSISVDFCKIIIDVKDIPDKGNIKFPFCMIFGNALMMAIIDLKNIDINSLDQLRTRFIHEYFKNDNQTKYPNILYDYQQRIEKAGHSEAYNHWILMKGDEDGFDKWKEKNKTQWSDFITWFNDNQLKLSQTNKFYRKQY